ncbi:MAG: RNA polymerase sigma factor [Phycisphaerales bacterium JB059]
MPASPSETPASTAVKRLIEEHGGRLYQLASRFCGNRDEAEDLVQEVFLNAYRGWDGFRGESDERTWLYRIAARACQRMHRKRSGEPERIGSLSDLLPFGAPRIAVIPAEQDDALQQQITAEARERLEAEITHLPEDFRVPLILKEIAGFSVREVAEILGLEEATVRSRVHRARLKLRAAVERVLPKTAEPAPPPRYPEQTCLDLLNAKQESLDRGVEFDNRVICERCRSVFASLDLTQQVCQDMARGDLPAGLRERLIERLQQTTDG